MRYSDIINEAKETIELFHDNVEDKIRFYGQRNSEYLDKSEGFHFVYSKGYLILSSTTNPHYSMTTIGDYTKELERIVSRSFNSMGGEVNYKTKIITFTKEYLYNDTLRTRAIERLSELQKVLRSLIDYKSEIMDYKVKGLPTHIPKTVKEIISTDPNDKHFYDNKELVLYHGTTYDRAIEILRSGLKPNENNEYSDKVEGYSEHNVYLTTTPHTAMFYAKRQMKKDDTTLWAILKVKVPDKAQILPDDMYMANSTDSTDSIEEIQRKIKLSIDNNGEVAYKGTILPSHITIFKTNKKKDIDK